MTILLIIGVALVLFGALVLLRFPDRPGGRIGWHGFEVNSVGAGLPIIALGVVAIAFASVRQGNGPTPPATTTTEASNLIPFEDDFSTTEYDWRGGSYSEDAYRISAEREVEGSAVPASPRNALSDANLRIRVEAHRTGGTAQERYGYGIFCRGDGQNSFYAFTIWTNQATLAKRIPGTIDPIALADPFPDVRSTVEGDSVKELEAICTSTTVNGRAAVDLQFSVDGQMILRATDPDDCRKSCGPPIHSGSFGLRTTLGARGEPEDTLEVTFDNFEVREN